MLDLLYTRRYTKIGTIMLISIFIIFISIILLMNLLRVRDFQMVGTWLPLDYDLRYSKMILNANGTGHIVPYNAIDWHTRNGQLILTSMGVRHYYSYSVLQKEYDTKLTLTFTDHNGRSRNRMYFKTEN